MVCLKKMVKADFDLPYFEQSDSSFVSPYARDASCPGQHGHVVELEYTLDLKSSAERIKGSNPFMPTNLKPRLFNKRRGFQTIAPLSVIF